MPDESVCFGEAFLFREPVGTALVSGTWLVYQNACLKVWAGCVFICVKSLFVQKCDKSCPVYYIFMNF